MIVPDNFVRITMGCQVCCSCDCMLEAICLRLIVTPLLFPLAFIIAQPPLSGLLLTSPDSQEQEAVVVRCLAAL